MAVWRMVRIGFVIHIPHASRRWPVGLVVIISMIAGGCSDSAGSGTEQAEQAFAFEDGEVTYDEYATAINNVIDCARQAGINVVGPTPYAPDPNFLYYESSAETDAESAANETIIEDCQRRYSTDIEVAWANVNAPSQEENDQVYLDAIDCVETTTGDDLSDYTADSNDLNELIDLYGEIYIDCLTGQDE